MNPRFVRPSADECSPYYSTYIQLVPDGDIVRTLQVQQPLPVTFLWDTVQATILTYSRPDRGRLADLERNPNVALHFDVSSGDIIVITGTAAVSEQDAPSDQVPEWVDKYRDLLARLGITAVEWIGSS